MPGDSGLREWQLCRTKVTGIYRHLGKLRLIGVYSCPSAMGPWDCELKQELLQNWSLMALWTSGIMCNLEWN